MEEKIDWTREIILQLIEHWHGFECLYNTKHKFYHNKHARFDALNQISEKLKHFSEAIEPNDVKLKINYLRGQYSRELAKENQCKSGSGADDRYESTVYWFKELSFLKDFVKVRKGTSNFLYPQSQLFCDFSNSQDSDAIDETQYCAPTPTKKKANLNEKTPTSSKRASSSCSQEDGVLNAAAVALKSIASTAERSDHPDDEAFANYIKEEMIFITNPDLKDDLRARISLLVLEFKKKQRNLPIVFP